ncbi:MAG: response regulator [bacterium]|nr:response regulator [bacterium]
MADRFSPINPKLEPVRDESSTAGPGRILVMDDEEMIRDLAEAMFGRYGLQVDVVEDGAQALERFEAAARSEHPYDAVVLDLRIPGGIGGREIVAMLRETDTNSRMVATSGDSYDSVMLDCTAHGFDAAIVKPYTLQQVAELLHKLELAV